MKARVQEKVLSLFQAWGPLHRGELPLCMCCVGCSCSCRCHFAEMNLLNFYYIILDEQEVEKLKRKGVMFPAPKPEDLAPYEARNISWVYFFLSVYLLLFIYRKVLEVHHQPPQQPQLVAVLLLVVAVALEHLPHQLHSKNIKYLSLTVSDKLLRR